MIDRKRRVLRALLLASVATLPAQAGWAQTGGTAPASSPAAEAKPAIIPTEAFASRGLLQAPTLSPDGKRIATRGSHQGEDLLIVLDTDSRKGLARFGLDKRYSFEWVRWAGNDRLLVSVSQPGQFYGQDVRYTRLVLIDVTSGAMRSIGVKEPVVTGDDVIFVDPAGAYALVSMQRNTSEYPSVLRFDLDKEGRTTTVQAPRDGVWDWRADSAGQVRLGTGWSRGRLRVFYRPAAGGDLKLVERLKEGQLEDRPWELSYLQAGSDKAYVFYEGEQGRDAFGVMDFAARGPITPIWSSHKHDVEAVTFSPAGEPLSLHYSDDRERIEWLRPADKRRYPALGKALSQPDIAIVSRSHDDSRQLVWAGSEADPGALYVYAPGDKRMDQLSEHRPMLDFRQLAPSKAITYTARDGTPIRAYLTLPRGRAPKGLPLIVMPHGGPYGVRDRLTYDDWVQLLANRGYAVLQPNYRGSSGYGDAFAKLGEGQIGRGMQDDLDDAMDWAVKEGIAAADRVCLVGASYGGYAALWGVLRNPERYRCAASWAGVTDWDSMLRYDKRFFSPRGARKWRERVEGAGGFDLDAVSPYRQAHTLTRPVLIGQGTDDSVVPAFQYRRFLSAAAKAPVKPQAMLLKDEEHSFVDPANEKAWYDALVVFLAKHNPAE